MSIGMYKIGELAKRFDIKPDTLRFYEKHGLLKPNSRSEAGYRVYTHEDADKLGFIIRAKRVGFSLQEITDLLSIQLDKESHSCKEARDIVDMKCHQVEERIKELQIFHDSLQKLSQSCCGGSEPATHCSILEALESADSHAVGDAQ
ncbi:zinc-responsive transcriptional regulator [Vibrio breoganii]|nr:zinc-responsive transcriptional regulator [Vibrio breoganii]PMH12893.1 zinc-responsive transcriptional regulator [Vibrio breoganii]PMM15517.1 zinc-responsive transcriptional regulator [Vibrio breoganii]TKG18326.1 Zn(2+)-responsive transcriptional regulator [Vibrio breoganii]